MSEIKTADTKHYRGEKVEITTDDSGLYGYRTMNHEMVPTFGYASSAFSVAKKTVDEVKRGGR